MGAFVQQALKSLS